MKKTYFIKMLLVFNWYSFDFINLYEYNNKNIIIWIYNMNIMSPMDMYQVVLYKICDGQVLTQKRSRKLALCMFQSTAKLHKIFLWIWIRRVIWDCVSDSGYRKRGKNQKKLQTHFRRQDLKIKLILIFKKWLLGF